MAKSFQLLEAGTPVSLLIGVSEGHAQEAPLRRAALPTAPPAPPHCPLPRLPPLTATLCPQWSLTSRTSAATCPCWTPTGWATLRSTC